MTREISTPRDEDELALMEIRLERLRSIYDRWIRWNYQRILRSAQSELTALDHVPDEREVAGILAHYDSRQRAVLSQAYREIFPLAGDIVAPSGRKSVRVQRKAEEELDPKLEEWLLMHLGTRITDIDTVTLHRVQQLLMASPDLPTFRKGLVKIFSDTPYRATVIARTETTTASNTAMQITASEHSFGRPVTKTWETRMTATVRDSHRKMQGVTIPMEEPFHVPRKDGGYDLMMYPGDYSMGASAENTVNCRCWCTYSYAD